MLRTNVASVPSRSMKYGDSRQFLATVEHLSDLMQAAPDFLHLDIRQTSALQHRLAVHRNPKLAHPIATTRCRSLGR
jgi:hypothetical protein